MISFVVFEWCSIFVDKVQTVGYLFNFTHFHRSMETNLCNQWQFTKFNFPLPFPVVNIRCKTELRLMIFHKKI